MIEDGAVLHREAIDEVLEVVFRVLVEQAEWHGVKVTVEPDDAEIEAFLGRCVVLCLGFSAATEGGEGYSKCQYCHR